MSEAPVPAADSAATFIKRSDNQFRWSLGITVAALLIQVAFFSAVAAYNLSLIDWGGDPAVVLRFARNRHHLRAGHRVAALCRAGSSCVFACLLRPQLGWHMAMLVQLASCSLPCRSISPTATTYPHAAPAALSLHAGRHPDHRLYELT